MSIKESLSKVTENCWIYSDGENRCKFCHRYQFQDKHADDCPMGEVLIMAETLIERDADIDVLENRIDSIYEDMAGEDI